MDRRLFGQQDKFIEFHCQYFIELMTIYYNYANFEEFRLLIANLQGLMEQSKLVILNLSELFNQAKLS